MATLREESLQQSHELSAYVATPLKVATAGAVADEGQQQAVLLGGGGGENNISGNYGISIDSAAECSRAEYSDYSQASLLHGPVVAVTSLTNSSRMLGTAHATTTTTTAAAAATSLDDGSDSSGRGTFQNLLRFKLGTSYPDDVTVADDSNSGVGSRQTVTTASSSIPLLFSSAPWNAKSVESMLYATHIAPSEAEWKETQAELQSSLFSSALTSDGSSASSTSLLAASSGWMLNSSVVVEGAKHPLRPENRY